MHLYWWYINKYLHFPQMTIIWHKIRHFHITKSIWRQNKITNMSKRFVVHHMSKLGSWRFRYVKIDQHLLLESSIDKQRELSCAPNTYNFLFKIWETKSNLPTSVFIFSTVFQILKTKLFVFWAQACRKWTELFTWTCYFS